LQAEGLCLIAALEVFGIVSSPDTGRLSERQMSQVRSFVDEHMDQPISLSDMAQAAGLSRFHFSRAFKATTGESPYRFVATLRVEAASRILRASDLPLETVAASVGFNSTVQLRRAFQDRMGMSPQAFQRQSR
jgi:AraC family transcriptional regulator